MDCSMPGLPVHHQLPKLAQTHVHLVSGAIQPSHPLFVSFSSCLQSFPASGSFPMSQFLTSGGQIIGASASASVLPMNIQDWFSLELTGWISLQSKDTTMDHRKSKRVPEKHLLLLYREAWHAAVPGVAKSWTRLSDWTELLYWLCQSLCVDHSELWKILQEMGIPDHLTCLLRNLYAGQEATVRTENGTTDWFQIEKGVCQGCILSPCLFNLYAKYIMQNARLDEAQAGIKIAGRNINNSDMQMTPHLRQKAKN